MATINSIIETIKELAKIDETVKAQKMALAVSALYQVDSCEVNEDFACVKCTDGVVFISSKNGIEVTAHN